VPVPGCWGCWGSLMPKLPSIPPKLEFRSFMFVKVIVAPWGPGTPRPMPLRRLPNGLVFMFGCCCWVVLGWVVPCWVLALVPVGWVVVVVVACCILLLLFAVLLAISPPILAIKCTVMPDSLTTHNHKNHTIIRDLTLIKQLFRPEDNPLLIKRNANPFEDHVLQIGDFGRLGIVRERYLRVDGEFVDLVGEEFEFDDEFVGGGGGGGLGVHVGLGDW